MKAWSTVLCIGKALHQCLEHHAKRRDKSFMRVATWLPWFKPFWWVPWHIITCAIWIEWVDFMLGLSNGPMPYPFVPVTVDLLGFICLGPSKQSLMLWAWTDVAKNGPLQHVNQQLRHTPKQHSPSSCIAYHNYIDWSVAQTMCGFKHW